MKNWKLILYILIELVLILFARLVFLNTGKINQILTGTDLLYKAEPLIQNLNILQALLVFTPFIVVLYLIVAELAAMNRKRIEQEHKLKEASETVETEVKEDPEELLRQQEQLLAEQLENNRKKLYACLTKELKNGKVSNAKVVSETILSCISKVYEITQAEIFLRQKTTESDKLVLSSTYAFYIPEEKVYEFEIGEGLIGQVAKAGEALYIGELPQGYITVKSGLGSATPSHLAIIPWKNKEGEVFAIIEIATFKSLTKKDMELIQTLDDKLVDFYH